jgi:heme A synthase
MSESAVRPAAFSSRFVALTVALLVSTLSLIALGGLVRITGSGLGCPDWPLCHGRIIPPFELAPWIEYLHRLAAATVSALLVAFTIAALAGYRSRRWIAIPAVVGPALLVVQILLGRWTVLHEIPPGVAWVHTAVAMAILACVAVPACAVYPPWRSLSEHLAAATGQGRGVVRLARWLAVAAVAVYLLLLTGAYVTRAGASGACPGFPGCGAVADRPALAALQSIHMLHRAAAAVAALLVGLALLEAWRLGGNVAGLRQWVVGIGLVLLAQAGLGMTNVMLSLPLWSRGLHLVVAALLWAALVLLLTMLWRAVASTAVARAAHAPTADRRAQASPAGRL